jgi:hypothetical protein
VRSENDDRFETAGQAAKNASGKMVGTWAESGPLAPVTFGNATDKLDRSPNADQSTFNSIGFKERRS